MTPFQGNTRKAVNIFESLAACSDLALFFKTKTKSNNDNVGENHKSFVYFLSRPVFFRCFEERKKERKKVNKSLEYEIRDHGDNYFSPNICQGHLLCMMMIFEKENSETKLEELDEKRLFVQSLCRSFFKHKDLI